MNLLENKLSKQLNNDSFILKVLIFFITSIFAFTTVAFIGSFGSTLFSKPSLGKLEIASLVIMLVSIGVCVYDKRFYYLLLPFFLLAFPSVVNNLFPSFYISPIENKGASTFPFITITDIFVILGIVLFYKEKSSFQLPNFIKVGLLLVFVYFVFNIFRLGSWDAFAINMVGSYQIRYLFLITLLLYKLPLNTQLFKWVIIGTVLAILFLFLESHLFMYSRGLDKLSSGTLAMNVFGNVLGALSLLLIFLPQKITEQFVYKKVSLYPISVLGYICSLYMMVSTETRIALLTFILLYGMLILYSFFISKTKILKILLHIVIVGCIITLGLQKDKLKSISKIEVVNIEQTNGTGAEASEEVKEEIKAQEKFLPKNETISLFGYTIKLNKSTSSLFTRYYLGEVSINMFLKHPFLGIGPGMFNFEKSNFDFPYEVLIDSHNDYLSYLSSYGVFGILFIFIILLVPSIYFILHFNKNPYVILGLFNGVLFFAAFSNSNTFKAPVFAFALFCAFSLYYNSFKNSSNFEG